MENVRTYKEPSCFGVIWTNELITQRSHRRPQIECKNLSNQHSMDTDVDISKIEIKA